jgi:Carboxypeptidase regulatory-like domain
LPKWTNAATVFRISWHPRGIGHLAVTEGRSNYVVGAEGTNEPIRASKSDMRLAIVAFGCVLLSGISAAQASPSTKQPTSTVAGQVVQDPGGMPLKKVMVSLIPWEGGGRRPYATASDAEGHFQMNGVQAGDHQVTLERNGFVTTNRRSHSYSSASLSIVAGQDVTGLLFRMLPAGVIQGKIVDEDGDPIPNAGVSAVSVGSQKEPLTGTTNDLGDYRIAASLPATTS